MNIDFYKIGVYIYNTITLEMLIKFVIIYFFIVWIALLLWVIRDISNRTNSLILQILSILVILLLSPLGIFIYLIIRPSRTLFEKYYEDIEENLDLFNQIVEEKSKEVEIEKYCFNCNEHINHDFNFCPKCKICLKVKCNGCGKSINSNWNICPYCGNQKQLLDSLENYNKFRKDINSEVKMILGNRRI